MPPTTASDPGKLTPLRRYLTKAGTHPSDEGLRLLREAQAARWKLPAGRGVVVVELLRYLFDQSGQAYAELARRTGMTVDACRAGLALSGLEDPDLQRARRDHDRQLEEVRFQGRKQMITELWDLGQALLQKAKEDYGDLKPREVVSALKDVIGQAQLLSGEATSRIARSDEKFMTEEELERAIADLERRNRSATEGPTQQ